MILKVIVLLHSYFLLYNARELNHFEHITHFSGNFGDNIKDILQSLQNNVSLRRIDATNIAKTLNFHTISKEMLIENNNASSNISQACMVAIKDLLKPFKLIPTWKDKIEAFLASPAGKMADAWGKPSERLLLGNVQWIGAYDECVSVPNAKYCLSSFKLTGKSGGSYGSCFPKQCTSRDVAEVMLTVSEKYTKGIIDFDSSGTFCEKPVEYDAGVVTTLVIIGVFLILCLIGTFAEQLQSSMTTASPHSSSSVESQDAQPEIRYSRTGSGVNNGGIVYGSSNEIPIIDEDVLQNQASSDFAKDRHPDEGVEAASGSSPSLQPPPDAIVKHSVKTNTVLNLLSCFSLLKNTRAVLSTDVPEGSITSINGVRVISLTWVMLGHYYIFMMLTGTPDNILKLRNDLLHRFSFLVVANAYVSVDSFFVLSGLLVAYLTLRRMKKKKMKCGEILMFYLHRYIR